MISYQNSRLAEIHLLFAYVYLFDVDRYQNKRSHILAYQPMKPVFTFFDIGERQYFDQDETDQCHDHRGKEEIGVFDKCDNEIEDGIWRQTLFFAALNIVVVDEWLNGLADHEYADDADDRDECNRTQSRMLGENECAKSDTGGRGTEEDGDFVRAECVFSSFEFICQAVCDEDGEVIAEAKDESRDDDIDNIELDAAESHDAEYPYPCDEHGQKCDDSKLDTAIAQKQREEYKERSVDKDVIEVGVDDLDEFVCDGFFVENDNGWVF